MFSQVCVNNSVLRRSVCISAYTGQRGVCQGGVPRGCLQGVCVCQGGVCQEGYTPPRTWSSHPPRRPLQRTVRILLDCFLVVNYVVTITGLLSTGCLGFRYWLNKEVCFCILSRGVLVLLICVQIHVHIDCFSHSFTMEVWKPARWKTAKIHQNEHTPVEQLQ